MRRKKKASFSVSSVMVSIMLILGGIWGLDSIYRFFRRPDSEIVCIDDRNTETGAVFETESETYPFLPEDNAMSVQEANFDFGIFPSGYAAERMPEQAVHDGLLVPADSSFLGSSDFVDFQNKNEYYTLKHMDLFIQEPALRAMNALAEACFQETGRSDFMVYSTTDFYQSEGSLYSEVLPDRSTGFCLDLAFLNEDGTRSGISADNAQWLTENAYRFGFIQSVPQAEYHLRYVGKLHASIMKEQNFSLAEYLQFLRDYTVADPYVYTDDENYQMIVYFVPAAAFGSTDIPVPDNRSYEVSGNNTDGFIIWTSAGFE